MGAERTRVVERLDAAGAAVPGAARDAEWPIAPVADGELLAELRSYEPDLRRRATELVQLAERMARERQITTFGDGEGALLYLLIRALRPSRVFEVSPASGWSTNYILGALTDNAHGELHSFELAETLGGLPTERAIRRNLAPDMEQSRLTVHVGDARETTAQVDGTVDFVFLDSAHDAFFAEWYTRRLLPRLDGVAFVHDVHFWDRPEPAGEAYYVLDWAARAGTTLLAAGVLERDESFAPLLAPARWPYPSNAVVVHVNGPELDAGLPLPLGHGDDAVGDALALAESGRAGDALDCDAPTAPALLRICQLAGDADVRRSAAERLAARALEAPVIEVARALSAAHLHDEAVEAAEAALAARPQSLHTHVGAAAVLTAAGRRDDAGRLLSRSAMAGLDRLDFDYRYLWQAADLVRTGDGSRAAELERLAFADRPRSPLLAAKFFAEYLPRVRAQGLSAAPLVRTLADPNGRRALRTRVAQRLHRAR